MIMHETLMVLWDGLVVSASSSPAVGRGFAPGHVMPNTIVIMVHTASLLEKQALG